MEKHFVVIISRKHSLLKYVYFTSAKNALQAQLDAWVKFREEYDAKEEDWLLVGFEVSLVGDGPQQVTCLG